MTVQNTGASPVRYRRYGSGPDIVQRREGNGWREIWHPVVSYGGPVEVVISPGEQYSMEFLVLARLGSGPGEWLAPVSGEYRIGIAITAVDRHLEPGRTFNMIQYSEPFRIEVR